MATFFVGIARPSGLDGLTQNEFICYFLPQISHFWFQRFLAEILVFVKHTKRDLTTLKFSPDSEFDLIFDVEPQMVKIFADFDLLEYFRK